MRASLRTIAALVTALALGAGTPTAAATGKAPPRYLEAVKQELARLGFKAACEPARGVCTFDEKLDGIGVEIEATAALSDETNTVYVAIPRFLPLADREGPQLALARRLLDLNRRLVSTKLEWDALSGAVRLSTVLATDSTFDRKAFRSQVRALFAAAERLLPELEALAEEGAQPR